MSVYYSIRFQNPNNVRIGIQTMFWLFIFFNPSKKKVDAPLYQTWAEAGVSRSRSQSLDPIKAGFMKPKPASVHVCPVYSQVESIFHFCRKPWVKPRLLTWLTKIYFRHDHVSWLQTRPSESVLVSYVNQIILSCSRCWFMVKVNVSTRVWFQARPVDRRMIVLISISRKLFNCTLMRNWALMNIKVRDHL